MSFVRAPRPRREEIDDAQLARIVTALRDGVLREVIRKRFRLSNTRLQSIAEEHGFASDGRKEKGPLAIL